MGILQGFPDHFRRVGAEHEGGRTDIVRIRTQHGWSGRRHARRRHAAEGGLTVDEAVVRALDIGFESSAAEHTIDITTMGRHTGLPRRIEVWFHQVDGHWYLTGVPGPRSWYANLLANPHFIVHLKHGVMADLPATATPVDESTRRRVIAEVLDLQNRPEIAVRSDRRQNLDEWLAHSPLVEIVFDDEQLRTNSSGRSGRRDPGER